MERLSGILVSRSRTALRRRLRQVTDVEVDKLAEELVEVEI